MSRFMKSALLLLLIPLAGCGQGYYRQGVTASEKGDYDEALSLLYRAVQEKPDDYRAWRELGMAWYRSDSLAKAEEAFAASNRIDPNALSNFYLGLIFERTGEYDKAIRVYGAAAKLQGDDRTRNLIRERLNVLIDRQLAAEARAAVAGEDTLSVESLPQNSVAVVNFNGSYLSSEYQPLALGLAELVAMDLAKVSELRVLERIKINTILDELELGQSSYTDQRLAPRMGRLLGSRRLVLGTVTGAGDSGFRIDGRLVNTVDGGTSGTQSNEGDVNRFFEVEKRFVFALLDTMGIEISREERDAIAEVPTESFLAFMAFSKGLAYERDGRYEDAMNAFREAGAQDPGFIEAARLADKMELTSALSGESPAGVESFEAEVAPSMEPEGAGTDLARIQAANLMNGSFIIDNEWYWDFGSLPIAPPGGGPVWNGLGIIIIRGHLDAE